jgi:hypothetical protein
MADVWYIARDGEARGPIALAEFVEFIRRGHLLNSDYVWHDGLDDWLLGEDLLSGPVARCKANAPPQVAGNAAQR